MNETRPNVVWNAYKVSRSDRERLNGTRSCALWLTGLSGSGKSTLAAALEVELYRRQVRSYVLDGDNVRHGLNRDLGFEPGERTENIRRIGEVSKLLVDAGVIAVVAAISPYHKDRQMVRSLFLKGDFIEVYVKCSINECERRDPKGLYKKARNGEILNFTGVTAPYEIPQSPEITLETENQSVDDCVQQVLNFLQENNFV